MWSKIVRHFFQLSQCVTNLPMNTLLLTIKTLPSLPKDTLGHIASFLDEKDKWHLKNTNKMLHEEMKDFWYLRLNCKATLRYLNNAMFRTMILQQINKPHLQLALYIENYVFIGSHGLTLLGMAHEVHLKECPIADVDVLALRNVSIITLTKCNHITDISPLRNAKKLMLDECYGITDLSSLRSVQQLVVRMRFNAHYRLVGRLEMFDTKKMNWHTKMIYCCYSRK